MLQFAVANIKCFLKKMVSPSRINYKYYLRFGKCVSVSVRKNSSVSFGEKVYVGDYSGISALNGGKLTIENGVSVGKRNMIICHDNIVISNGTIMAPDVKVYDHDHAISETKVERKKYITSPIYIGENCWIGANVVILRGTRIGNNCVVGAGCILKGEYPDNSVIVQKKETVIRTR